MPVPDELLNSEVIPWEEFKNMIPREQANWAAGEGSIPHLEFVFTNHPELLPNDDGVDLWMWSAADEGDLDVVKCLYRFGADVNAPPYVFASQSEESPFYRLEGAIYDACQAGHYEVAKWLLEHGAKINFVLRGQQCCRSLHEAARYGHLDVVKLLVEHGADLHGISYGVNAIMEAKRGGHGDVIDYLYSVGMRDLREITPPDYDSAHKMLINVAENRWGAISEVTIPIEADPDVVIHLADPNNEWKKDTYEKYVEQGIEEDRTVNPFRTLFTIGMSDVNFKYEDGSREISVTELFLHLPDDWQLADGALEDPRWNWPIEEMKRIVQMCRVSGTWPGKEWAVIMNGDSPQPFSEETQLCGWLILMPNEGYEQADDYRYIGFRSMHPIYAEEKQLIDENGPYELVKRFDKCGIPKCIAIDRPNMAIKPQGQ